MRLFLALNLPEEERRRIRDAIEPMRAAGVPVRWVDPDSYHLTLKFLGEVRPEKIPVLERAVKRVAATTRVFPLTLSGFGAFPTIRRPEVLWVGVEPTPALRCLKQDLEWGLTSHGFERETRAFHPHVTLGRASEGEGAGAFRGLDDLAAGLGYSGTVEVLTVDLMRTHLSKQGTRHALIHSSPFKP
jgi:RNA 2',3'-cyclic 3'-phosphodiesterase